MTLVVARVTPIGVRVSADMRVTNPNAVRSGFVTAELKVILLRPTLCVAYAGRVGAALAAIREAHQADLNVTATEAHLLAAHTTSNGDVDFLVASLDPSRLVVIKDGAAKAVDASWLGDPKPFEEYQRIYYDPGHFQPPREFYDSEARWRDIEIATRMGEGMRAVVFGAGHFTDDEGNRVLQIPTGGAHESVGEAIMAAHPRAQDDLFAYSHQSHMIAPPFAEAPPGHTGVYNPGFGSAERGSFSYYILTPSQPGVGVVGIYFPEGRYGLLYAPLLFDQAEPYPDVTQDQFVELVWLRRSVQLEGIGLGIDFG